MFSMVIIVIEVFETNVQSGHMLFVVHFRHDSRQHQERFPDPPRIRKVEDYKLQRVTCCFGLGLQYNLKYASNHSSTYIKRVVSLLSSTQTAHLQHPRVTNYVDQLQVHPQVL